MNNTLRTALSIITNLLLAYVAYSICRAAFLLENWDQYSLTMTWQSAWKIFRGGIWFDTSAICYTNILYIVLAMLPFASPKNGWYKRLTKYVYLIPNALCIILNLGDSVYYPFGHHRITTRTFNEFGNEDNLGRIFGIEFINHWYLVLLAAVLIFGMYKLYQPSTLHFIKHTWKKWVVNIVAIGATVVVAIWGMRGATFFTSTRPIALSNAQQFATRPSEANVVLNTPFSLIRTIGKRPPMVPKYYTTGAELDSVYTPLHHAAPDSIAPKKKNVVILIVESFATEFIGGLNNNRALDDSTYRGYTTWMDSFIPQTLTFETTLANTGVSIDAMPAILSSIPRMRYGFFLSPYSLNHITSFATELKNWDYHTAFFHGGTNDSMGFQAFARGAGFEEYYGLNEYCEDDRFNGKDDFDGTWAIWDEEFLQYYALKMTEMPEPFVTGVFTASSHHPFAIPDRYKDRFKDEGIHQLHKCIRYTDYSLGRFFETAKKQPWYDNTIFVLTADHASSKTTHPEYKSEAGDNHVPIVIFDPSGEMPRGVMPGMMQQLDILPTVLGWLGYDRDFIAFGNDVLNTPPSERWGFNWNFVPQMYMGRYFMQADENCNVTGLYDYKNDILMHNDLKDSLPEQRDMMQRKLKGLMQSYFERMEVDSVKVVHADRPE